MSPWHLVWIIPICTCIGWVGAALMSANKEKENEK